MTVRVTPAFRTLAVLFVWAAVCPAADPPAKDAFGDPLPDGAIARLCTERMRKLSEGPCQLTPDGKRLIGPVEGKLSLLDPATGTILGPFGKYGDDSFVQSLSADGSLGILSSVKGVKLVSTESGKVVFELARQHAVYHSLQLTSDAKLLAVGNRRRGDDKAKDKGLVVEVYDVGKQKAVARLTVAQNTVAHLLLSDNGKRGVTWGEHYTPFDPTKENWEDSTLAELLQFWDVTTQKVLSSARLPAGRPIKAVAISPGGEVAAASDGEVTLFDTTTGKLLKRLLGRGGVGNTLVFSPDGRTIAAGTADGCFQLWEVATGKPIGVTPPPVIPGVVRKVSFVFTGPARGAAVAVTGDGAAVVWDVPTGNVTSPLEGHLNRVVGVTFSAGDKELFSVGSGGDVIRWSTGGKRLADIPLTIPGVRSPVHANSGCLVPPEGDLLVRTGPGDRNGLDVFDLTTGRQRFATPSLFGRSPILSAATPSVAVSSDRTTMVLGATVERKTGLDSRLAVFDLTANTMTREVSFPETEVVAVAVTPDGSKAGVLRLALDEDLAKMELVGLALESGKTWWKHRFKRGVIVPMAITGTRDNKTVLVNDVDSDTLAVFDLTTGEKKREFADVKWTGGPPPVFSADGKRLALARDAKTGSPEVCVYDFVTGKKSHSFRGHGSDVSCLAFSKDGKTLASGSLDTTVLLWDLSKEK